MSIYAVISLNANFMRCSDAAGISEESTKAPAKTKSYIFHLINVLFSEEVSAKFISLGEKKDKNVLDSGLAGFNVFFLARGSREILN
jgi:hypothetical protein